jgi:hypothetical protein
LGGAILVAVLAMVTELAFALVERSVRPKGAPRTPSAVEPLDEMSAASVPQLGPGQPL